MPKRAPRLSRAQEVAAAIEDGLLAAATPVGTSLGRRVDLMREHSISPTVMNEVLRILRDRDLVEVRPGAGGGIFVASQPPHLRLGAIDVWFSGMGRSPQDLFEARTHLEDLLTRVAVDRAGPEDFRDMEWALEEMRRATDAMGYLSANLRLHRAIGRASRLAVLVEMHESIAVMLSAGITRAVLVDGAEEVMTHNIRVHEEIVSALRARDHVALEKALQLHGGDLSRATSIDRPEDMR